MTTTVTSTSAPAVLVDRVWKRFGNRQVVQDVTFSVQPGQVMGLVGPNGAGKTTAIRILLSIIEPDQGRVTVLGESMTSATRERIGYLPEERGLYRGQRAMDVLVYLAALKGLSPSDARARAGLLLERFGLGSHRTKKISEMSRGMGQLVQFAATIIHRPAVVALDEPFASLDPVNVRLMKDVIGEMRQDGAAVLLSTHQMSQVEELCDHVTMISDGRVVLQGELTEVRRRFRGDRLFVVCDPWPEGVRGVDVVRREAQGRTMRLAPGTTPESVLRQLLDRNCSIERFEVATPSMEEIFVAVVKGGHA